MSKSTAAWLGSAKAALASLLEHPEPQAQESSPGELITAECDVVTFRALISRHGQAVIDQRSEPAKASSDGAAHGG